MLKRRYRLSVDDNIRFMEQLCESNYSSLFHHPYLQGFYVLHQKFGLKVHFNMFFSYAPGSFSLAQMTDRYRAEFEQNAHWLKFSFHGLHNDPPDPYRFASNEELLADYRLVMAQLKRIVGTTALSRFTTLHYVTASQAACRALASEGLLGLTGMFLPGIASGPPRFAYYLSAQQAQQVWQQGLWRTPDTGLWLIRNDLVINSFDRASLPAQLKKVQTIHPDAEYLDVMIHEQYFYPDYEHYQPDFFDKLTDVALWMETHGYTPILLDDFLPGTF